jgi:HEAT repeat protein
MGKIDDYRKELRSLGNWDAFLMKESGLPGPRGNLELAQAVSDEGNKALFVRYAALGPDQAPVNSPREFLAFCGVLGLGRLLAEGDETALPLLREHASDPRWRTREAVAMALQRLGGADMKHLLAEMEEWSQGSMLEKRAAAAALCEPRLLRNAKDAERVLHILDRITGSLLAIHDCKSEDFRVLRQALGYCWSVAAAALPVEGKALMERWFVSDDQDIRWIMRENLKKNRLARMDAVWVEEWRSRLAKP